MFKTHSNYPYPCLIEVSFQARRMKLFETGENRSGKSCTQGLIIATLADQSVGSTEFEAGYFRFQELQKHYGLSLKGIM